MDPQNIGGQHLPTTPGIARPNPIVIMLDMKATLTQRTGRCWLAGCTHSKRPSGTACGDRTVNAHTLNLIDVDLVCSPCALALRHALQGTLAAVTEMTVVIRPPCGSYRLPLLAVAATGSTTCTGCPVNCRGAPCRRKVVWGSDRIHGERGGARPV